MCDNYMAGVSFCQSAMAQVLIVDTLGIVGIGIALFVLLYVLLRLLSHRH
ncbi:MAG: hypothetical protein MUC90_00875 [Thermoplasmata archaeon]|nr:hypothetical protein [Thermoplasmata archaeon]